MRVDQAFDPSGGLVEAFGQTCNLIAALDLDPCGEIAGPQRFDAALQALQSSREPSHHRPGAERDDKGDGSKEGREHERAGALPRRQACNQASAIRERYRNGGAPRRPHPPPVTLAAGGGKRPARRGPWLLGAAQKRPKRPPTPPPTHPPPPLPPPPG